MTDYNSPISPYSPYYWAHKIMDESSNDEILCTMCKQEIIETRESEKVDINEYIAASALPVILILTMIYIYIVDKIKEIKDGYQ